MTPRFSEAIRRWAGWCPNRNTFTPVRRTGRYADAGISGTPDREVHAMSGVIVDYGGIGIPVRLFIAVTVGLAVIVAGLFVLLRPVPALSLLIPAAVIDAMVLYGSRKAARIAVDAKAITIRRPLFPPLVIPRDTVVRAEVKENRVPISPRHLVIVLTLCLASYFAVTWGDLLQPDGNTVVFWIAIVLFTLAMFYHAGTRARYPQVVTVTTTNNRLIAIYTDDPEGAARMLGVS